MAELTFLKLIRSLHKKLKRKHFTFLGFDWLSDQVNILLCLLHFQHEAVKAEMAGKQRELDQFSIKGKQLVIELKKIPDCDSQMMKKDMETLVDQWLDVSLTTVMMC